LCVGYLRFARFLQLAAFRDAALALAIQGLLLLLQLVRDPDQALELAVVADVEHRDLHLAARERHVQLAADLDDGCLGVVEGCARLSHACESPVASERSTLEIVLVALRPLPRAIVGPDAINPTLV